MRYVVTGHARSGTTMLFRMMLAGGLNTTIQNRNLLKGSKSYHPNPHGYYEYDGEEFPDEYAIKDLGYSDTRKVDGVHLVVGIKRNYKEVAESFPRSFGAARHVPNEQQYLLHYEKIKLFCGKHGFQYIEVNYNEITKDAKRVLVKISDFGFPIDINKAVSIFEESLYRNRA